MAFDTRVNAGVKRSTGGFQRELAAAGVVTATSLVLAQDAAAIAAVQATVATQGVSVAGKLDAPAGAQQGDLLQFDGAAWVRLPRGNVGQVLVRLGSGLLGWVTPVLNIF